MDEKIREALNKQGSVVTEEEQDFINMTYGKHPSYSLGFIRGYKSALSESQKEIERLKCCGNYGSFDYSESDESFVCNQKDIDVERFSVCELHWTPKQ
jgi:hypothetical protein